VVVERPVSGSGWGVVVVARRVGPVLRAAVVGALAVVGRCVIVGAMSVLVSGWLKLSRLSPVVVTLVMPSVAIVMIAAAPMEATPARSRRPARRGAGRGGVAQSAGARCSVRRWRARASRTGGTGETAGAGDGECRPGAYQRPSRPRVQSGGGRPWCHRRSASHHQSESRLRMACCSLDGHCQGARSDALCLCSLSVHCVRCH
jgi:hypothetical protein